MKIIGEINISGELILKRKDRYRESVCCFKKDNWCSDACPAFGDIDNDGNLDTCCSTIHIIDDRREKK